MSVGFGLPIWKSGFIASEPYYPVRLFGKPGPLGVMVGGVDLPAFSIDFRGWYGMSGSPVFARYTGIWDMTQPYRDVDFTQQDFWARKDVALSGEGTEFIGIYSGRIVDPAIDTQRIDPAGLKVLSM